MTSPAVVADGVTKWYRHAPDHPRHLKDAVLRRGRGLRARRRLALDGVSFEVPAGTSLGLVGPNGAGKSTLLRLLGGVGRPDAGTVAVRGRVGALLELGAGLHPDLTGRENAVLLAVASGLTRREACRRLPDVAAFAGLERVLDDPVRTYSSGMRARLGFSVAVHVDADVLLVDEVLAVGDAAFQQRCLDHIGALRRQGVTVVLASHDAALVAAVCDEVVWLRGGRVAAAGPPGQVVARYREAAAAETAASTPDGPAEVTPSGAVLELRRNRFGDQSGRVSAVSIVDALGLAARTVAPGAPVTVSAVVDSPDGGVLAVTVTRADGVLCVDTSTDVEPGRHRARLDLARVDLAPGDYAVSVGLYAPGWGRPLDLHHLAYPLRISGPPATAVLAPPAAWEQEPDESTEKSSAGWGA